MRVCARRRRLSRQLVRQAPRGGRGRGRRARPADGFREPRAARRHPTEFVQGDVADAVTATGAADGCQAIVNFAAKRISVRRASRRAVSSSRTSTARTSSSSSHGSPGSATSRSRHPRRTGRLPRRLPRRPAPTSRCRPTSRRTASTPPSPAPSAHRAVSASSGRARRGDRTGARRRGLATGDALRHVGAR